MPSPPAGARRSRSLSPAVSADREGLSVPIDATVPQSPGWWMLRLARKLELRQPRLAKLDAYYRGDPPLPKGAENQKKAYQSIQRMCRTNFAELAVRATRQRMKPTGVQTSVDNDETGDVTAWQWWQRAGMSRKVKDVLTSMLTFGDGYVIVGLDESGQPVITAEDPRQVVTAHDPLDQRRVIAALKIFHDPVAERDLAYLYLPGEVWVATRPRKRLGTAGVRFSTSAWTWNEDLSADLPAGMEDVLPVIRFRNQDGVGEFERHIGDLDRINDGLLQRTFIAKVQAFKQRAIKGDLPDVYPENHPQAGQTIDYDGIFVADPGALWMIPEAADIWESTQVDLTPILASIKADVLHFAAATQTPLAMFSPESANQTAEGATAAREGLVFKVEDCREIAADGLVDVMAMAFRLMGDDARADRDKLGILWAPVERLSLAEKGDAASKAANDMPVRARLIEIWQLAPAVADRYVADLREEQESMAASAALGLSALSGFGPEPARADAG